MRSDLRAAIERREVIVAPCGRAIEVMGLDIDGHRGGIKPGGKAVQK
jgi:hypothetical protein